MRNLHPKKHNVSPWMERTLSEQYVRQSMLRWKKPKVSVLAGSPTSETWLLRGVHRWSGQDLSPHRRLSLSAPFQVHSSFTVAVRVTVLSGRVPLCWATQTFSPFSRWSVLVRFTYSTSKIHNTDTVPTLQPYIALLLSQQSASKVRFTPPPHTE